MVRRGLMKDVDYWVGDAEENDSQQSEVILHPPVYVGNI
jgi:hypothetical protein